MANFFLRLKHWQIFCLIIGIPSLFHIIYTSLHGGLISALSDSYEFWWTIASSLMVVVMFLWWWAMGSGLQSKIPAELRLKTGWFHFCIIFPALYCIFAYVYLYNNAAATAMLFLIILIPHLFAMYCMFYCMYFMAKTIKTAELQKKVGFGDFAGEFFLIWFFPIGIWFVQPKVNKLAELPDE